MASSTTSILKDFSGKLGDQFVLKRYGNKSVICMLPQRDKRKKRTEKQLQNNQLMATANKLAQDIIDDPAKRDAAQLFLNVTRNKLYTSLVRLYFQQVKEAKEKGEEIPNRITIGL
ncbi:hypothetical protein [Flavihumibacter sp. UBA7668]|uniref:hypothetical protein n=1 Tax=Flavihumibacter sp. UBA7668 TaxID=1946542 RepID=UPI0025C23BC7|nr:hypothetical protein [Flavihumibacter sp. UBA7668]